MFGGFDPVVGETPPPFDNFVNGAPPGLTPPPSVTAPPDTSFITPPTPAPSPISATGAGQLHVVTAAGNRVDILLNLDNDLDTDGYIVLAKVSFVIDQASFLL